MGNSGKSGKDHGVRRSFIKIAAILLMGSGAALSALPAPSLAQQSETSPAPIDGPASTSKAAPDPEPTYGPMRLDASLTQEQIRAQVIAAEIRIRRGQAEKAHEDLVDLGQRAPFAPAVWTTRALAFQAMGKTRRAWQDLRDALALDPANRDALMILGQLYVSLNRPTLAAPLLERLNEACPFGCPQAEMLAASIASTQKKEAPAEPADAPSEIGETPVSD